MSVLTAAGVILFREPPEGRRFLLLKNAVHGTWGFPKGHVELGESLAACAAREVAEETGGLAWQPVPGFQQSIRYRVEQPTPRLPGATSYEKEVTYLLGRAAAGPVRRSPEHDDLRWVPLAEALVLMQHADQGKLLEAADSFLTERERG